MLLLLASLFVVPVLVAGVVTLVVAVVAAVVADVVDVVTVALSVVVDAVVDGGCAVAVFRCVRSPHCSTYVMIHGTPMFTDI